MKEEIIMDALGYINDAYVTESAPSAGKAKKRGTRWKAAALALLLGAGFFTLSSPGAAAAAYVKEQVVSLIEALFPPKELVVMPEGVPENITHVAGGQESSSAEPGFVIYYDPGVYEMTEEDGVYYIRSIPVMPTRDDIRENNPALLEGLSPEDAEAKIDELLARQEALYAELPSCELEIRHLPDIAPDAAAQARRLEMQPHWETVTETERYEPLDAISFLAGMATEWNSPVERLIFVDDMQGGTYQITMRYFTEAAEGHGVRLSAIANSFEVIPPQ